MRTFEDLFDDHVNFTSTVFPLGTSHGALLHAQRELKEIIDEFGSDFNTERFAIECVDFIGCVLDAAKRVGIPPEKIKYFFEAKLQINKGRKWKYNGDGSYSHVKISDAAT